MINSINFLIIRISLYLTVWLLTCVNPDSFILAGITDSLIKEINTAAHDTVRVNLLNKLCKELNNKDPDKAFQYARQALELAKEVGFDRGEAESLLNLGVVMYYKGDYEEALAYDHQAITILEEANNKSGMAKALNNIGVINLNQSNYGSAVEYFLKSLKIKEELGDQRGIAAAQNNIGIIFQERGDYDKSLGYYFQSLKTSEKLNDNQAITRCLNNIGVVYQNLRDYQTALVYYRKALKIKEGLDDKKGIAIVLNNIGVVYNRAYDRNGVLEDFEKAMTYYRKSLEIREILGDKSGIADNLNNMGTLFEETGDYENALDHLRKSIKVRKELEEKEGIARGFNNMAIVFRKQGKPDTAIAFSNKSLIIAFELEAKEIKKSNYQVLSRSYADKSNYKMAFENYKLYAALEDSLFNEAKSKEIGKLEAKYEFEKADEERRRANETARIEEKREISRRNNLQYSGILIFIVMLFTSLFMLGKFSIPIRLAEGIVFFSFLLFFEFTLVLLDPYIEHYSSGAPAIKLGFNALLAGMIFPLHAFFENKLKRKLLKD